MAEPMDAWHLDRKVPLGLIAALLLQTGAAFWWASGMESRQAAAEAANARQDAQIGSVEAETQRMQVGAATVNAQLQAVRESLSELKEAQHETNNLLRQLSAQRAQ